MSNGVELVRDETVREVAYAVTGKPVIEWVSEYTQRAHRMRPDRLHVKIINGKAPDVYLSGPAVRKNGENWTTRRETVAWLGGRTQSWDGIEMPDYVRDALAEFLP